MKRFVAAGLLALGLAPAAAAAPPPHVEITFTIRMGGMRIGEGREVLEHDGKRYHLVSESKPRGLASLFVNEIRRESRGTVTRRGLRPDSFEETGRRGGTRSATFDWPARALTLVDHTGSRNVALPRGTLDQASFAYALAFRPGAGGSFTVHVTDGSGVKQYDYRELGEETLDTPLGEIRARRFERVRAPDERRGFEFWLAPDRHWLPVKLRYVERNGETFDSIVTAIRVR
jgi:hypothetical protein